MNKYVLILIIVVALYIWYTNTTIGLDIEGASFSGARVSGGTGTSYSSGGIRAVSPILNATSYNSTTTSHIDATTSSKSDKYKKQEERVKDLRDAMRKAKLIHGYKGKYARFGRSKRLY